MKKDIKIKSINPISSDTKQEFPLFVSHVQAGFPSPADDYMEKRIDLNKHLINQ